MTETRLKVRNQFEDAEEAARSALSEAEIAATAYFDAGEKESNEVMLKFLQRAHDGATRAKGFWSRTDEVLARTGLNSQDVMAEKPAKCAAATAEDAAKALDNALSSAAQFLKMTSKLILPKLLPIGPSIVLFLLCCILLAIPAVYQQPPLLWLIGGLFAGAVLFAVLRRPHQNEGRQSDAASRRTIGPRHRTR